MKKQTFTLAALAVASFGWISLAAAQGPEGGRMRGPGGPGGPQLGPGGPGGPPFRMIVENLGLSDEQKAQWKAIHEEARQTGEPIMKKAREAREAFEKALESGTADAPTVGQAAIAMRSARGDIEAHHKATLDAAKAILTPEQLAKFEETQTLERRGPRGPGQRGPQRQRRGPGIGGAGSK